MTHFHTTIGYVDTPMTTRSAGRRPRFSPSILKHPSIRVPSLLCAPLWGKTHQHNFGYAWRPLIATNKASKGPPLTHVYPVQAHASISSPDQDIAYLTRHMEARSQGDRQGQAVATPAPIGPTTFRSEGQAVCAQQPCRSHSCDALVWGLHW